MHFKDKQIRNENADAKAKEEAKMEQAENAVKKEEWWASTLYPDPPYVSDR